MRLTTLLLSCLCMTSPSHADQVAVQKTLSVRLQPAHLLKVRPAQATTREDFEADWGQFEASVPKQYFPIAAPNCRSKVILRMPGVPPDASQRKQRLETRWRLFQAFHALTGHRMEQLKIGIAPGPYMSKDKQGRAVLEYCNAYIALDDAER
jgi:hypothetical protein